MLAELDRGGLEEALELQHRSYQLLLWLSEAVPRGFVSFNTAHEYASAAESARAWILEHLENLPPRGRPPGSDEPTLTRFSNVFSSYLETSFDLVEKPRVRLRSKCGCLCAFCAVAVAAPHLKTKRLSNADKARARKLERTTVEQIAASRGLPAPDDVLAALLEDRAVRESAAMVAYACELRRRCDGSYSGPWVLALWRTFAWTVAGSPKSGFRLDADDVHDAVSFVADALQRASSVQVEP